MIFVFRTRTCVPGGLGGRSRGPRGGGPVVPGGGFPSQTTTVNSPHFVLPTLRTRIKIYVDFDVDFWSFFGRSWGSFSVMLVPFSAQVGPGTVFEPSYLRKSDFSRNRLKQTISGVFSPKMAPQNDPRSFQDGSKIVWDRFFSSWLFRFDFWSFGGRFWFRFGAQMAPKKWGRVVLSDPWGVQDGLGIVLVRIFFRLAVRVRFFGSLGLLLGCSWGCLGSSWALLGLFWGTPGSILEPSTSLFSLFLVLPVLCCLLSSLGPLTLCNAYWINESNQCRESMNRIIESSQWIESMNRISEWHEWIEWMNRINESNHWIESMKRVSESNQWIESVHRIGESNQWIESVNGSNEPNQWIESMNRIHESNPWIESINRITYSN